MVVRYAARSMALFLSRRTLLLSNSTLDPGFQKEFVLLEDGTGKVNPLIVENDRKLENARKNLTVFEKVAKEKFPHVICTLNPAERANQIEQFFRIERNTKQTPAFKLMTKDN